MSLGHMFEKRAFLGTRKPREGKKQINSAGEYLRISDYFGENTFDVKTAKGIPKSIKDKIVNLAKGGEKLAREDVELIAKEVTRWAMQKGATHFCHWFQPLTGQTAEKHDSFLTLTDDGVPIDQMGVSQLLQGESDASSLPHGDSRSTFEARGYTSWDFTSPLFLIEGTNGKTLCIPTAFVSFNGDALDVKTPLLRSTLRLNKVATKFLNLTGKTEVQSVKATCGAEQEYFLVDKALYFARPDLVMSGRTLFGSMSAKNQQLEDHYFGIIPARVLAFMQELDVELYRLGIPSKTRHNEVAPGQFEIAPIFEEANLAADHNQVLMAQLRNIASKHDFHVLLHEKPFSYINGSGKHLNWSMVDDHGTNLLDPGDGGMDTARFLAVVSMIVETVYRHSDALRMSVCGAGNDHRLGGNEAPPSIISVYLGKALLAIFEKFISGGDVTSDEKKVLDVGVDHLATLLADDVDRNRTSPFAFTSNRFEFRAVGSDQSIGFPLAILNAAVSEILDESNSLLEEWINRDGMSVDAALRKLTKKWMENAERIVFNGDGYSKEWVEEAKKRGLPNFKTTPDAVQVLIDEKGSKFLINQKIFRPNELKIRYNIHIERYNTIREIEFNTFTSMINHFVIPAAIDYKIKLCQAIKLQSDIGEKSVVEKEILGKLEGALIATCSGSKEILSDLENFKGAHKEKAHYIADKLMPKSNMLAKHCHVLEEIIPCELWALPKYYDLLFLR